MSSSSISSKLSNEGGELPGKTLPLSIVPSEIERSIKKVASVSITSGTGYSYNSLDKSETFPSSSSRTHTLSLKELRQNSREDVDNSTSILLTDSVTRSAIPLLRDASQELNLRDFLKITMESGGFLREESLQNALNALHQMEQRLISLSQHTNRESDKVAYVQAKRTFEVTENSFFIQDHPFLRKEGGQIALQRCVECVLKEVKELLEKKVFLKLVESVTSPYNQAIIKKLVPGSEKWFIKISELDDANKQREKKTPVTLRDAMLKQGENKDRLRANSVEDLTEEQLGFGVKRTLLRTMSHSGRSPKTTSTVHLDPEIKRLSNDYDYLKCVNEILELYKKSLLDISNKIHAISMNPMEKGSKKGALNECIIYLIHKNIESFMIPIDNMLIINYLISKIQKLIEEEYLKEWQQLLETNNKKLIQNIQQRKSTLASFSDLESKLNSNLFMQPLPNPLDVERAMVDPSFSMSVNGKENIDLKNKNPAERFYLMLTIFSQQFFNNPDIFNYLAQKVAQMPESNDMYSHYEDWYKKFINLKDEERDQLKTNFEQAFGKQIPFEKVLKYFKFSQHFLGQATINFITKSLMATRFEKFQTEFLGIKRTNLPDDVATTTIFVMFKGSSCEIRYVRKNGLLFSDAIATQEYSFLVDADNDQLKLPKEKIKLSVECSHERAENEELKDLLFDLSLIMDLMSIPPLEMEIKPDTKNYLTPI